MTRTPTLVVLGLIALAGLVYFAGIVFEAEYPYYFTIRQAARATTLAGRPVSEIVERMFPGQRYHWHTCSYCSDYLHLAGLRPMWLHTIDAAGNCNPRFLVAFHKRTGTMVSLGDLNNPELRDFVPVPGTAELRYFDGKGLTVPYTWHLEP